MTPMNSLRQEYSPATDRGCGGEVTVLPFNLTRWSKDRKTLLMYAAIVLLCTCENVIAVSALSVPSEDTARAPRRLKWCSPACFEPQETSDAPHNGTETPIYFGAMVPMTGRHGGLGKRIIQAWKMAVDWINDNFG